MYFFQSLVGLVWFVNQHVDSSLAPNALTTAYEDHCLWRPWGKVNSSPKLYTKGLLTIATTLCIGAVCVSSFRVLGFFVELAIGLGPGFGQAFSYMHGVASPPLAGWPPFQAPRPSALCTVWPQLTWLWYLHTGCKESITRPNSAATSFMTVRSLPLSDGK